MILIKKYLPFIIFVFSFLFFLKAFFLSGFPDFWVHFYSPLALLDGKSPYTFSHEAFFPNVYPPVTIIFFFPFVIFSLPQAEKIWFIISLLCLLSTVYLIFKLFNKQFFSGIGFLVLTFCFLSFPVKFNFGMGQINTLILFFTVLAMYMLKKKKIIFSSIFLSLSISMKFFPVFFPFYFLFTKQWKFFVSFVAAFILFNFLVFLIFPNLILDFYTKIIFTLVNGWKTDYYNQSLTGFIGRLTVGSSLRELLRVGLSLIFVCVTFLVIFKTRFKKELLYHHFSILIILNLIVNNFSWQHHFIFMIFPFLTLLFYALDKKNYKMLIVLLISYFLIAANIKTPINLSPLITSHVLYGAIAMWILQIYVINKFYKLRQPNLPKGKKH